MPLPKVFKTREFHASLLGVVAIATLAMNIIAFSYDEEFTKFLYGDGIDFDAPDAQKARAEATVFAKQIEEESIVLLKNDRSTLPFQSPKLNVFGYGSSDHGFIHQGGGSGKTSEYARRSFYDSLKDAGVELNPTLVSFYNSFNYSRYGDATIASLQFRNYEPDPSVYSQDFFARAKEFSPNAAIVFSRPATEKLDIPSVAYDRYGAMDETRNSLALTDNEQFLLDSVASNFSNVVVILNSGSPMELSFADDNGIPSILNVGYPGNTGCEAIGEILLGHVNPSGRTTDTFVYDSRSNPAYFNCGDLGNHGFSNSMRYVDYAESVYVGYRYYETLYEENGKDERSYWRTVAFPFGHGLSYTEFEWTLLDTTFLDETGAQRTAQSGMEVNQNGSLSFQVWVENVGKQAGRDVVEIYANPPYYEGEIEKSAANLVSFAKTSLLEPGKGELLSLTIPLRRLASYDAFDANDNGFIGYELEGGRYRLSLRHNAHEDHPLRNRDSSSFDFDLIDEGIHYATDEETGAQVSNLFTTMHNERSGANSQIQETQSPNALSIDGGADQGIRYLTRSDLKGTFPKATRDRAATKAITDTYYVLDPRMEEVSEPAFGTKEIQDITQAFDKPYDDEAYEKLTRSATKAELANLVAHAGFGTPA
ncbi:MAG: glycoside hydrolase family 3 C-terminal domain-containing protein, partial [Bacilli bacterium]|nr:glycoside hydrolase family 3 C-terminal domain-containing protein [Bacilli bacterium]